MGCTENLRYQWAAPLKPFVAANYHYVSRAPTLLQTFALQNPTVGDYSTVGLRAGIALPNILQVSAFVDNLSDHRGVTTA
jgi:outer membrane cobalamin receptor